MLSRRGFLAALVAAPAFPAAAAWATPTLVQFQWVSQPGVHEDAYYWKPTVGWKAQIRRYGRETVYGDWVVILPEHDTPDYRVWARRELRAGARMFLRERHVPYREADLA